MASVTSIALVLFVLTVACQAARFPTQASVLFCPPNFGQKMIPCIPAMMTSAVPTEECCTAYTGLRPCLCEDMQALPDALKEQLLNDSIVKKLGTACDVDFVSC